jgi:hypothetical protein
VAMVRSGVVGHGSGLWLQRWRHPWRIERGHFDLGREPCKCICDADGEGLWYPDSAAPVVQHRRAGAQVPRVAGFSWTRTRVRLAYGVPYIPCVRSAGGWLGGRRMSSGCWSSRLCTCVCSTFVLLSHMAHTSCGSLRFFLDTQPERENDQKHHTVPIQQDELLQ